MFTFVITSIGGAHPAGQVLDFGTYHHRQCAIDTAKDSPLLHNNPNTIITIVGHDDDGSADIKVYV